MSHISSNVIKSIMKNPREKKRRRRKNTHKYLSYSQSSSSSLSAAVFSTNSHNGEASFTLQVLVFHFIGFLVSLGYHSFVVVNHLLSDLPARCPDHCYFSEFILPTVSITSPFIQSVHFSSNLFFLFLI